MKALLLIMVTITATGAEARRWQRDYPSCNLAQQRGLESTTGGGIKDARQAHISMRANILQADIGSASKARPISKEFAERLWMRVDTVREATRMTVSKLGRLSVADRSRYDRQLDAIARQLCR